VKLSNLPDLSRSERADVLGLLGRLSPGGRVDFLRWCCKLVAGPGGSEIRVMSSTGGVRDVWNDLLALCGLGLPIPLAAEELVRRVRVAQKGGRSWG
jgi:hypothetical protein